MPEIFHEDLTLPAHIELDKYHPANQDFFKRKKGISQVIVAQSMKMHPRHVHVAKMKLRGRSNDEIGAEVGIRPNTVAQIYSRDDVKELTRQLIFMDMHLEGPELALRKHLLWEIAVDAKKEDPRITISAIQELNKIAGIYNTPDSTINITINQGQLPRGALDA